MDTPHSSGKQSIKHLETFSGRQSIESRALRNVLMVTS
jgi:hypothetical protein